MRSLEQQVIYPALYPAKKIASYATIGARVWDDCEVKLKTNYIYIYIYIYIYVCVCVRVCVYVYVCVFICVCLRLYGCWYKAFFMVHNLRAQDVIWHKSCENISLNEISVYFHQHALCPVDLTIVTRYYLAYQYVIISLMSLKAKTVWWYFVSRPRHSNPTWQTSLASGLAAD